MSNANYKNLLDFTLREIHSILEDIETILIDCDGTLWHHNKPIPGTVDVFNTFKKSGKQLFMLSNNSTKTHVRIAEDARTMKYQVDNDHVLNTAYLTASFLNSEHFSKKVYIVGAMGISEEMESADIENFGAGPENTEVDFNSDLNHIEIQPNVGAVVVGHDIHISYVKLIKATTYLKDSKCLFIGTSCDERLPSTHESSLILPGPGSLLEAIETASNREAFIIGKPHTYIHEYLVKNHNINPRRTLIVGDSVTGDIEFGYKCGYTTLLVLTGDTTLDMLKSTKKKLVVYPDFYVDSLGSLVKFFNRPRLS
ncbi:glycerol-3-phosphate phosphatase [Aethina tumida]|uniref:glycerol-3-phosphate phosphatase n=1 Tax=Aethina tumida TaxID=116153 RepID=UPI00096B47CD|nr:glycerol-3-phosphate phosphatase [Aethina tumida]